MLQENFVRYVQDSIRSHWTCKAFTDYQETSMTYQTVGQQILRWHSIFENCNIKRGDKIALVGKNSSNWALIFLATTCYGAVIVPILHDFTPKDTQNLVNHSDAVLLFGADSVLEKLKFSTMPNLIGIISLSDFSIKQDKKGLFSKAINKTDKKFHRKFYEALQAENFTLPKVENHELIEILYTSGTSGLSKGVMLNHNTITANVLFARKNLVLRPNDRVLSFLPLAHCYGCAFDFLYPFSMGANITFLGKMPTPQILLQAFKIIQPRIIFCVPLIIEKIYKSKLKPILNKKSIQLLLKIPFLRERVYRKINAQLTEAFGGNFYEVIIGGAALNKEVEAFLNRIKFRYTVGYGMTECGPLISYSDYKKVRLFTTGKGIETLEIRIDSSNPQSEVGEILVKGENVLNGYYKNEFATQQALDSEGYLHTGDLGILDKDGYIHIRGRSKSMILGASGQNIYPEEIEALLDTYPLVQEALVVERQGQLIALVFPDLPKAKELGLNATAIEKEINEYKKLINNELPKYMAVAAVEIVESEFEKTPKRSIKRFLYTTPNFAVHQINQ